MTGAAATLDGGANAAEAEGSAPAPSRLPLAVIGVGAGAERSVNAVALFTALTPLAVVYSPRALKVSLSRRSPTRAHWLTQ